MVKEINGDFIGGPVVKNMSSNAAVIGLLPGQGTKLSPALGQLKTLLLQLERMCSTKRRPTHCNKDLANLNKTKLK